MSIRLPADLKKKVRGRAKEQHRTMVREVIVLVELGLAEFERLQKGKQE